MLLVMSVGAIVVAAGRGERLGHELPKGFVPVGGVPMLVRSIDRLRAVAAISCIQPVIPAAEHDRFATLQLDPERLAAPVDGGAERQDSVAAGLAALPSDIEIIAVHDAARCLVDPVDVARAVEAARDSGAALLAAPASDTIKLVEEGVVVRTPPRESCWAAQTPQVFRAEILREAHSKAQADGFVGTDDAQLVERLGIEVHVVAGSAHNIKITHRDDLEVAEAWLLESQ
ncbi:MAG: 2-C-methyl-D-erythritol 4-phosphate cytidylyltransferase [Myxococcota bacterium]|nr:2-C-methyl-D-erythritol 4-phosphate cytidylyltransferase [Myxococcota bacterium]